MSDLTNLIKVAMLGTEREATQLDDSNSPLGQLLNRLDDSSPEHHFLSQASAITLHEQAGKLPKQLTKPNTFSQKSTEELLPCSPAINRRLGAMIEGQHQNLLPELLTALAKAGQRVPEEHLPNLLARGAKSATLRPTILPVLGESGRWLASQNPAWGYAAPKLGDWDGMKAQWDKATPVQKQTLLRQMRHLDPEQGRQLLESTWKTEPPPNRLNLMKSLDVGLSMADEPFLEIALDDRTSTVRRKAADLLAQLPQSRLCQRMIQHTATLLRWAPRNPIKLHVKFPSLISPTMIRDGVLPRPKGNLSRIRAAQMLEMLGAVPLDHWTNKWQVPPERIIAATRTSQWPRTLIRSFSLAAERQNQQSWAKALIETDRYSVYTVKLVKLLEITEFQAMLQHLSNPKRPLKDSPFLNVLRKWPHPWNDDIARIWIDHITAYLKKHPDEDAAQPTLRTNIKVFARLCPTHFIDEIVETHLPLTKDRSYWQLFIQDFIAILKVRQAMLAELTGD